MVSIIVPAMQPDNPITATLIPEQKISDCP